MSERKSKARTYAEMTIDSSNPLVRYSHRKRMAKSLGTIRRYLEPEGVFVDFGAGDGLLLDKVRQSYPRADLIGVEPYEKLIYPGAARYVAGLPDLADDSVNVICAFEVCEHLYPDELQEFLEGSRRVLRAEGHLILSAPIMQGLTVGLKALNHLRNGFTEYSFNDVFRATLGFSVTRPPNPRITHKGFDFRELVRTIEADFRIESRFYSPISGAPWFLNSQVFLVCVPVVRKL
jgi:SAM-dependent methyltransferase